MAKPKNYKGRHCKWEFENTFLSLLKTEGWQHLPGSSISRPSRHDVLYTNDLELFLGKINPDLTVDEVRQFMDTVRLTGEESSFAALHKVYGRAVSDIPFTPQCRLAKMLCRQIIEHSRTNHMAAKKLQEMIDTKSSFADWLNNQIRNVGGVDGIMETRCAARDGHGRH